MTSSSGHDRFPIRSLETARKYRLVLKRGVGNSASSFPRCTNNRAFTPLGEPSDRLFSVIDSNKCRQSVETPSRCPSERTRRTRHQGRLNESPKARYSSNGRHAEQIANVIYWTVWTPRQSSERDLCSYSILGHSLPPYTRFIAVSQSVFDNPPPPSIWRSWLSYLNHVHSLRQKSHFFNFEDDPTIQKKGLGEGVGVRQYFCLWTTSHARM